jgi:hypothetical protein
MDAIKNIKKDSLPRRKVRCSVCMDKWIEDGKDLAKMPAAYLPEEIKDGFCPCCKSKFRAYFPL